jgi:DNA-binding NarL/FixJ family response regulator
LNKQLQVYRTEGEKTIKILLADDQPGIREGLRMRLTLESDVTVVGEAGSGEEAIRLARALRPDVVLMDVRMAGMDGIEATAALRAVAPESSIVILSLYDDARTRARAKEAGAAAFVAKHHKKEELLAVVRQAAGRKK